MIIKTLNIHVEQLLINGSKAQLIKIYNQDKNKQIKQINIDPLVVKKTMI